MLLGLTYINVNKNQKNTQDTGAKNTSMIKNSSMEPIVASQEKKEKVISHVVVKLTLILNAPEVPTQDNSMLSANSVAKVWMSVH